MWILKNYKDILHNFNSRIFSKTSSIQTFHFSTLYTTISYEKIKTSLVIPNAFYLQNGRQSSKFIVLGHELTYFVKHETEGKKYFTKKCNEAHCLTNHRHPYRNQVCPSPCRSFSILLWGWVYTNCIKDKNITETKAFNLTFVNIDDILSINKLC
jgi:hypothetical protein